MAKIANGEWVVVCDGRKALLLENAGDERFPNLQTREVREAQPVTMQPGEAPGRVHQSVGSARSAVEQTNSHDESERDFLESLAKHLDDAVRTGQVKSLVLVAPPRALGMIRPAYSQHLRKAIRIEIDKDLVKIPVYEIEKHIASGG